MARKVPEGMCIATGVHLKKEEEERRRRQRWRRGGGDRDGEGEEEKGEKQQLMETRSQTQIWQIIDRDCLFVPGSPTRNNHSETMLIKLLLAQ